MKNLFIALLLIYSGSIFAQNCQDQVFGNKLPTTKMQVTIICKDTFVIGFNPVTKQPAWVAYHLTPEKSSLPKVKRTFSFRPDSAIPRDFQVTDREFVGTDFDKGHLAPYEDISYTPSGAIQSFLYTNVSPQYYWFNRGIWKSLETQVRSISQTAEIYIITGPIIQFPNKVMMGSVPVPDGFWKVVINAKDKTIITYILPQRRGIVTKDLPLFVKSTTEVLKLTAVNPVPSTKKLTPLK